MATTSSEAAAATAKDGGKTSHPGGGGGEEENPSKRLKTADDDDGDFDLSGIISKDILTKEKDLQQQYKVSKPYPHCVLSNLFVPEFLKQVRLEIKDNSKVNFKESDLFKMYQSIDLANLKDDEHGKDVSYYGAPFRRKN